MRTRNCWARCGYGAILVLAAPVFARDALTFSEVLRRAETRVQDESARANLAQANLKYLETQSKLKWELRPQLALFSFSNPMLLASSLGLSLLPNRSQQPSPWTWQTARFDALDAEVAEHQATVEAQAQAGRLFFDVLAKQKIQDQLAEMIDARRDSLQNFERRSSRAQTTAVTRTRLDITSLEFDMQLAESSAAYQAAVLQLASFLDLDANDSSSLRLLDPSSDAGGDAVAIPDAGSLRQWALRRRPDLKSLRDEVAALQERTTQSRRVQIESPSFGFSHVGDTGHNGASLGSSGALLGGYSGRSDLGLRVRLHDNGEDQALTAVTGAQIHLLNLEIEKMERSIGWEVQSLRASAVASAEQARLAQRKLENIEKLANAINLREQSGLESSEAALSTQMEVLRVRTQYRQAQSEWNARFYHLLAVCGLGDIEPAGWKSLPALTSLASQ